MIEEVHAELVVDGRATVGEGPVWDDRTGVLWWVDIEGRRVHAFDPETGSDRSFGTASMVGAVALRAGGGLVLALADRLALVDGSSPDDWTTLTRFDGEPSIRCNDAKCDPAGRLLVGRMALDERPVGALVSVDRDGVMRPLRSGLRIPNGLAWSADARTMFHIDTPTKRIDAFDYDIATGSIRGQRVHRSCDDLAGAPDGMTIDADGGLWVAFWGGSAVRRFAPDGRLDAVVHLPVSQVTSCTFGGLDLSDLYITTAARGVDEAMAGGLFRARPGVRGVAADAFAG
jgi:sugar lactone lactonase YvrE